MPNITMLQQSILRMYHVLALVLCVSASEDFDWTKNERTSFYYGTFPTGRTQVKVYNNPPVTRDTIKVNSLIVR